MVPPIQAASYATLDRDYAGLRDAMWAADSARERLTEHFGGELGRQVEGIVKQVGKGSLGAHRVWERWSCRGTRSQPPCPCAQVATISMQAQHDMVLDERSNPEVVIAFTGKLVERVEALQVGLLGVGCCAWWRLAVAPLHNGLLPPLASRTNVHDPWFLSCTRRGPAPPLCLHAAGPGGSDSAAAAHLLHGGDQVGRPGAHACTARRRPGCDHYAVAPAHREHETVVPDALPSGHLHSGTWHSALTHATPSIQAPQHPTEPTFSPCQRQSTPAVSRALALLPQDPRAGGLRGGRAAAAPAVDQRGVVGGADRRVAGRPLRVAVPRRYGGAGGRRQPRRVQDGARPAAQQGAGGSVWGGGFGEGRGRQEGWGWDMGVLRRVLWSGADSS